MKKSVARRLQEEERQALYGTSGRDPEVKKKNSFHSFLFLCLHPKQEHEQFELKKNFFSFTESWYVL